MGSVGSANAGLSDILQTIDSASPSLSSVLSQSNVQAALEQAPSTDIVQLSDQAIELQQVSQLFGAASIANSTGEFSPSTVSSQALQALETSFGGGASGSVTSQSSLFSALSSLASENGATPATSSSLDSLFSSPSSIDSLINTLA